MTSPIKTMKSVKKGYVCSSVTLLSVMHKLQLPNLVSTVIRTAVKMFSVVDAWAVMNDHEISAAIAKVGRGSRALSGVSTAAAYEKWVDSGKATFHHLPTFVWQQTFSKLYASGESYIIKLAPYGTDGRLDSYLLPTSKSHDTKTRTIIKNLPR